MAITRLFQTGFEMGRTGDVYQGEVYYCVTISTTLPYTGAWSANTNHYNHQLYHVLGVDFYQYRTGWFYNPTADITPRHTFYTPGGDIRIYRSNTGQVFLWANGSLRDQTADGLIPNTVWGHWGIDAKIDASGWVKVYLNGILELSFEGDTGSVPANTFWLAPGITTTPASAGAYGYRDDWYIDDTTGESTWTAPPMLRFPLLTPNDNGHYSEWTPTSGSGFECVDERPWNDADFIQAENVGQRESHNMDSYTLDVNEECRAVIPIVRASKSGIAETIKLGTRLSGTDLVGSEQQLPVSPGFRSERQPSPPGGGDWEQADIDDFEVYIESSGSF